MSHRPALSPTTTLPISPSSTSPKSAKKLPLLSLAPPALAWDESELGESSEETNVGEIWNVITRAADLVKDGERLENLAWRHWGSPLRIARRRSSSSISSASSLHTPPSPLTPFLHRPSERRTFCASLKLLLEPTLPSPTTTTTQDPSTPGEATFRDWVTDAKRKLPPPLPPPPTISLPDTPIANHVEIRLVEPTPVPSRVGSLGGSLAASGLSSGSMSAVPPRLSEESEEEEEMMDSEDEEGVVKRPAPKAIQHNAKHPHPHAHSKSPKKKGKFFVQSSPSKGSGSDSPHPSPVAEQGLVGSLAPSSMPKPVEDSGSSSGEGIKMKIDKGKGIGKGKERERGKEKAVDVGDVLFGVENGVVGVGVKEKEKRHVSLSTMRGRFTAEKRKAAEALKAKEEDSGWEDDEEDAGDDEEESIKVDKGKSNGEESNKGAVESSAGLVSFKSEEEGDWSDEPESQEKTRKPSLTIGTAPAPAQRRSTSKDRRSSSNLDMNALLMRTKSRTSHTGNTPPRETPPPPAPTPLRNMTKKQRIAAQEERAKIEAELDAQRKREMFAKQQIFGKGKGSVGGGSGLLTGMFKSGGSMVDLTRAPGLKPGIRSSPTHGHLPALSRSPARPSLLRSKSAVAMPIQTGVSVTAEPHTRGGSRNSSAERSSKGSKGSQEVRVPAGVDLESSDEDDSDDDDYLATSQTQRKIAELAAKRDAKTQAVPVAANAVRVDDQGVALGLSPTSRRRQIIMNEMSESLRRNLIVERQKSSGGTSRHNSFGQAHSRPPPSTHTTRNNSTTNLQQYTHGAPLERHRSEPRMQQLTQSVPQPYIAPQNHNVSAPLAPLTQSPAPVTQQLPNISTQPPPRRPGSTVLGGGFLRPLTRVGDSNAQITRTQSSATLASPGLHVHPTAHSKSPSPILSGGAAALGRLQGYEAPAMVRRSTEGDPREFAGMGAGAGSEQRRRELRGREMEGDTSFRAHGW